MAGWNPNQGFSMPMFNPWVPEKVRPWIYLLFALFFQLSSGVYFGSLQQMVGATGFTREDMVMVAMFGVVGRSCSATNCASPISSCSSMPPV